MLDKCCKYFITARNGGKCDVNGKEKKTYRRLKSCIEDYNGSVNSP